MSPNALELRRIAAEIEDIRAKTQHAKTGSIDDGSDSGISIVDLKSTRMKTQQAPLPKQVCDDVVTALRAIPLEMRRRNNYHIIITRGSKGVVAASSHANSPHACRMTHVPPQPVQTVESTSGAGDTLAGALIWSLLTHSHNTSSSSESLQRASHGIVVKALQYGVAAAALSVGSKESISPLISCERLEESVY